MCTSITSSNEYKSKDSLGIRRVKIIATIGPASLEKLEDMIKAGMNLARVNFSHGTKESHLEKINLIRKIAKNLSGEIGIIADLQGPKIRIGRFKNSSVQLKTGNKFTIDTNYALTDGNEIQVGTEYKNLAKDVKNGDILLLDDGKIELTVDEIVQNRVICTVKNGGILSDNKGLNKYGGGLTAKSITEKDIEDLVTAVKAGVDYIAISFPRNAADVMEARNLIKEAIDKNNKEINSIGLIAKIERAEAVENIDEIIVASDAVMVARGDLGVEIGYEKLPAVQKHIINRARALNKAVVTATQMMESMIQNPIPTRAEVLDVANAVLDGTDAVMLSAETATGKYPVAVIEAMSNICVGAEKHYAARTSKHRVECHFERIDEAIAMSAMYAANHFNISAIICMTESGSTPLWMSRIRSGIPIYGFANKISALRRMTLYRGVYPIYFECACDEIREQIQIKAINHMKKLGKLVEGEYVIITDGQTKKIMTSGGTNTMQIMQVGKNNICHN